MRIYGPSFRIALVFTRKVLAGLMICAHLTMPLAAQDDTSPARSLSPLPIAWTPLYPLVYEGRNGEVAGFMVDLAVELGREVGFEPQFFRVSGFLEWAEAQRTGVSVLLPAAATSLPFLQTNLFSDQVFEANVDFALRLGEEEAFDPTDLSGLRIGTLRPGEGSDPALYPDATMVDYTSVNAAMFGLLAGDIDAISTTSLLTYSAARRAGLDNRIAFARAHVLQSGRHVAIHESRPDLLEPINEALARMKADGRLAVLLAKHDIVVPSPPPDVLVVGVSNFPPYLINNDDGTFSGFGVETFGDLAELAGLNVEYQAISAEELGRGPTEDTYDVLAQIGVNPGRQQVMDFTLPVLQSSSSIFTLAGEESGISNLDSLVGLKVGVGEFTNARRLAEDHDGLDLIIFKSSTALLDALTDGSVDAILFSTNAMNAAIRAADQSNEIVQVQPPFHVSIRAPALRPGLGVVRERLNAVIPGYLISEDYVALQQKYFEEPVFWTPQRIYLGLIAIGAVFLTLLGYIAWQRYRQRRNDLAVERAHVKEQRKLVEELERSNRDLDEFAYIASHDLKEPLRGVSINANFLLREDLSETSRKRAERMVHLTGRMEKLITDLLFFSRLGRGDERSVVVAPEKVIDEIRSDLSEWLQETGGEIVQVGEIPTFKMHRVKLKTVLQNLIVNGIKYNEAKNKCVEVGFVRRVDVNDEALTNAIFVRDNGIGIDAKYRDKIFRIFSRLNKEADYATSSGSGTGSGLAFTRKIVEDYGGKVLFDKNAEAGTVFYVTLPQAGSDA